MISRERLERVLRVRATGEAAAKGNWSRARAEQAKTRTEADAAVARREELTSEIRARAVGPVNPRALNEAAEVREAMKRDLDQAQATVRRSEEATEARRRELESAHRAVKAIRNLVDRGRAEFEAISRVAEARERDDRGRRESP